MGTRYGIFTITNFRVDSANGTAVIGFEDVACLSGGGASLKYRIKEDVIEYTEPEYTMMS